MAPPSRRAPRPGGRGTDRTGATSGAAVQVVGLKELRRELKKLEEPREWSKALGRIHREVAKAVAETARGYATQMGGSQKHFAAAIRGYGSAPAARLAIADPKAFGAFWGAKQRWTGWNARNGDQGRPNQPEWVGNTFPVGVRGQGPYAVNDAIADRLPWIEEHFADQIDDLLKQAFPD